jgi:hypothetical protein
MSYRPGRGFWFGVGLAVGAATALGGVAAVASMPCSLVYHMSTDPIVLHLPSQVSDDAIVSVCFDHDCTPESIDREDKRIIEVPQVAPYRSGDTITDVSHAGILVEIREGAEVVLRQRFPITQVSEGPPWSRCPGPFHHAPVHVSGTL